MTAVAEIPQAEWLAEAKRRFGKDPLNWRFVCPGCGTESSGADFNAAGGDLQGAYQSCIGRIQLERGEPITHGCDWAAFGLLQGPQFVLTPDGARVPVFAFAGVTNR